MLHLSSGGVSVAVYLTGSRFTRGFLKGVASQNLCGILESLSFISKEEIPKYQTVIRKLNIIENQKHKFEVTV